MARYQYETSPRKIEPRYKSKPNKKKLEVIKNDQKKKSGISKKEHERRKSQLCSVLVIFALLVVISYRNSLITEEFKSIQDLKEDLYSIEKENKQIEVTIEGSQNLNKIEKIATEQLGMQKRTVDQTIYTELPKEDYIESSIQETEEEPNWFQKILNLWLKVNSWGGKL